MEIPASKLHIEKEHSVIQLVTQPETTNTVSGLEQSLPLPAPLEVEITNNSTLLEQHIVWVGIDTN